MLMNVVNLFTQAGIYARDMNNWDWKVNNAKTYLLFRPFIQDAYQRRLTSGPFTTGQGGYASFNRFAGLTTNNDISNNDTAETIAGTINNHMANVSVSAQTTMLNNANMSLINASLQQFVANKNMRN
jgi:hypothetical protein